jgi:hypothetical protein
MKECIERSCFSHRSSSMTWRTRYLRFGAWNLSIRAGDHAEALSNDHKLQKHDSHLLLSIVCNAKENKGPSTQRSVLWSGGFSHEELGTTLQSSSCVLVRCSCNMQLAHHNEPLVGTGTHKGYWHNNAFNFRLLCLWHLPSSSWVSFSN